MFHSTKAGSAPSVVARPLSLALLPAVLCLSLGGCNDTRDLAPLSASTPWHVDIVQRNQVPTQNQASKIAPEGSTNSARVFALPKMNGVPNPTQPASIDSAHQYTLPELIDLAQTRNQDTRVAWEQARQAAIQVGISQAALLPELTVDALGGYTHSALPFPSLLVRRGYITADSEAVFPEIVIKYLLLDFGGRRAAIEAARQLSFAGNVGFTAAHQKLIMNVAKDYFLLTGLNAQLASARTALANARLLETAASARFARGEGTVTDVAIARSGVARAAVAIPEIETARSAARLELLALLNLPPQTRMEVEDSSARPLLRPATQTLDAMMSDALRQRPDLLADLAKLRASEQGIALARSELLPKISIAANVQGNIGQISTDGGPYESVKQPQVGLFLRFDWALYQGGARLNTVRLAQSRRAEADAALQSASTNALREVALAYEVLNTSLSQYDATVVYQTAAQIAFDAATSAYVHGVGTLTDAANAQTSLAAAQAAVVQSHSQALVNAAALAFATGNLTSANTLDATQAAP